MEKLDLSVVKALIVEIPALPLSATLEKFSGHHSLRTLSAAQRMAAKKRKIKIPRNPLLGLYKATGGWETVESCVSPPTAKGLRQVAYGDLVAVLEKSGMWTNCWLCYRGLWLVKITRFKNGGMVNEFITGFCQPYDPPK